MPKNTNKQINIAGSEKKPLAGAKVSGKIDHNERIEITVLVRSRAPIAGTAAFREMLAAAPTERVTMTREQWRAAHGADPADFALIEEFAYEHELDVVRSSIAERRVVLSGTIAALTKAFSVKLQKVAYKGKTHRQRTGGIGVPAQLAKIIEDVKGFDNRRQAQPHFRLPAKGFRPRTGTVRAFTPIEVGQLYNFPTKLNGSGECIAIIELGGGYRTADLKKYFTSLGLATPKVSAISVDGGHNTPGQDADGEVMLDIEVPGRLRRRPGSPSISRRIPTKAFSMRLSQRCMTACGSPQSSRLVGEARRIAGRRRACGTTTPRSRKPRPWV